MHSFSISHHDEVQDPVEVFELHQMAYDFHQEVDSREAFEAYCDWYEQTAACHRQELDAMKHDIDLLGMFWRR
ncbi:MAG: hypothetical protein AAF827_19800 [Cyanobacteria bacterium P01_D01_bin.6]